MVLFVGLKNSDYGFVLKICFVTMSRKTAHPAQSKEAALMVLPLGGITMSGKTKPSCTEACFENT
jgi:hypothetical protein